MSTPNYMYYFYINRVQEHSSSGMTYELKRLQKKLPLRDPPESSSEN